LAPLLINSVTRQGAQVFLEGSRYTTRELFVLPKAAIEAETEVQAEAEQADAEQAALKASRAALAHTG
jgi:hypothetical protein